MPFSPPPPANALLDEPWMASPEAYRDHNIRSATRHGLVVKFPTTIEGWTADWMAERANLLRIVELRRSRFASY